jgi:hypothetical protein
MAVLCAQYDLLFIGNQRTGSTAVGRALERQYGGVYVPRERIDLADGSRISKRHSTLAQIERYGLVQQPLWSLLKFAAVRNPFDSLVSMWAKNRHRRNRADSWVSRQEIGFPEFVARRFGSAAPQSMNSPWTSGCDAILRFESLGEELDALLRSRGAPPLEIEVANRTAERARDYRRYYDDATKAIVERVFAEDLERFDYAF